MLTWDTLVAYVFFYWNMLQEIPWSYFIKFHCKMLCASGRNTHPSVIVALKGRLQLCAWKPAGSLSPLHERHQEVLLCCCCCCWSQWKRFPSLGVSAIPGLQWSQLRKCWFIGVFTSGRDNTTHSLGETKIPFSPQELEFSSYYFEYMEMEVQSGRTEIQVGLQGMWKLFGKSCLKWPCRFMMNRIAFPGGGRVWFLLLQLV